jgi:hypothetical protein
LAKSANVRPVTRARKRVSRSGASIEVMGEAPV